MKDSNLDIAFQMADLQTYIDDPLWFRKSLLKACSRDVMGEAHHVEFLGLGDNMEMQPIVTTLRYIRAIVPDEQDPVDDEMTPEEGNIDKDTCIILIPDEKGMKYVEPISQCQVLVSDARKMCVGELYDSTIDQNTFLIMGSNSNNFMPFGYVTEGILKRWQGETVPYSEELIAHFKKMKRRTENNFGYSFVKPEEIITLLNTLKTDSSGQN